MATAERFRDLELSRALELAAAGARGVHHLAEPVIQRALDIEPEGDGLQDIEHFVFLMQENRSFDHYFGTMSGVAGFGDSSTAFSQKGFTPGVGPTPDGVLMPFRLDIARGSTLGGTVINDPNHSWAVQHESWHDGAMDQFLAAHLKSDQDGNGPATMGYYRQEDIPVHWALANAFTICDHYHCSVLGPTDPNRLYWMTGTIDPERQHGGPLLNTPPLPRPHSFSWPTYPEALQAAGVSWKLYRDQSLSTLSHIFLGGMLDWFKAFDPGTPAGQALCDLGVNPSFPQDFRQDVKDGTLPSVSWIIPSVFTCEHPALPPALGALGILEVMQILTSNRDLWSKTALIISYDENGGFFDHVPPPVPPLGTPGEFVAPPIAGVEDADGIAGPIGLGFRVPCLVISPFSRGGRVAHEVFDHTSQLRLLETRFGVPVTTLSPWRRAAVGDLTSAFSFNDPPADAPPLLPPPPKGEIFKVVEHSVEILLDTIGIGKPFDVPPNAMPVQDTEPLRPPAGT
jgi:phospholipase C